MELALKALEKIYLGCGTSFQTSQISFILLFTHSAKDEESILN